MTSPERNRLEQQVAQTAGVVRAVATETHRLAHANPSRHELATLAVLARPLAEHADNAARTIDTCLATAFRSQQLPETAPQAARAYQLSKDATDVLDKALETAITIYAAACDLTADDLALLEEHLPAHEHAPMAQATNTTHLSAACLAGYARAIRKS